MKHVSSVASAAIQLRRKATMAKVDVLLKRPLGVGVLHEEEEDREVVVDRMMDCMLQAKKTDPKVSVEDAETRTFRRNCEKAYNLYISTRKYSMNSYNNSSSSIASSASMLYVEFGKDLSAEMYEFPISVVEGRSR